MSPLDDARAELADFMKSADYLHPCGYCGADVVESAGDPLEHEDGCKVPTMTRIVAALEAAERVISTYDHPDNCDGTVPINGPEYKALVAAMQGARVPT